MNSLFNDTELVDKLQKGDIEAFDQLYRIYAGRLYRFGFKYLNSTDEAEELVQSVFLKVWENYGNLNREKSFRAYIFTIAYNNICRLFRNRYYWRKYIDTSVIENRQTSTNPEEELSYQAVLDHVQQIISELPEKQRAVFLKSKIEGKSAREIAKELKLAPATVDNYVSEVLKFVRNKIKDKDLSLLLFYMIFLL